VKYAEKITSNGLAVFCNLLLFHSDLKCSKKFVAILLNDKTD
jgi:hypothetical protein